MKTTIQTITMSAEQSATYFSGAMAEVRALMAELMAAGNKLAAETGAYVEIRADNGELFELIR